MLHSQRTATHGISFVLVLFSSNAQRQHVNEPHRRRLLLELSVTTIEVPLVVPSDLVDAALELHRLVELVEVTFTFQRRVGREHHIFILAHDVLVPRGQPRDAVVVLDVGPRSPGLVAARRRSIPTDVDRHSIGFRALFHNPSACVEINQ